MINNIECIESLLSHFKFLMVLKGLVLAHKHYTRIFNMAALQIDHIISTCIKTLENGQVIYIICEYYPFRPKSWTNMQQKCISLGGTPNH